MQLKDTPLAAAPASLDRAAVVARDRSWSWREVHGAAVELAQRLPPGATVCNLCDSRLAFLVAWLAALRRGCLQILPPSSGRAELAGILKASATPVIVSDDAQAVSAWSELANCVVIALATPATRLPDADLAWLRDGDPQVLSVRLYTSGSTGTPAAQTRSLAQLARGAQVLAARLDQVVDGGVRAIGTIVCSVPPQHMFGLEASVMLPLIAGMAVRELKPLLPADVHAAFAEAHADGAWVATPLHLRALALSGLTLPRCRLVLASTMPLSSSVASQAETLCSAPVMEIYGSTETGVVAMRRTALEAAWRPVDGVCVEPGEAGASVSGDHFPSPQVLADQVERHGSGGFVLLGRQGDLIKIAGRRASLASLNRLLDELPGLDDGVFYLPPTNSGTQRLVLVHAGAPLDPAATRQWLRSRMDPLFLPRELLHVERLPRTATGKLQRAALDELYAAVRPAKTFP
jgi:acyl-coenzyme A synthetase/AMP-(fatty) acid ligase